MRKILSLLLCVAMLCSLVVISVQADATPAADFASVAVALPGTSVTIDMKIANNPGIAAIKYKIVETTETKLNATFAGADNGADTLGLTTNDAASTYFWSGAYDVTGATLGSLAITIPASAANGTYTFEVQVSEARNAAKQEVAVADTTFSITVIDKIIDGVNVAIDADTAIGIHVQTSEPDKTSITAVDVDGGKFITITDYVEDEENGGYFYYLNVNPWDMDKVFTVDFTDNFTINEAEEDKDDTLDTDAIPGTAKTVSILGYCEKVKGTSDELDQLIADLLAFGQQAQIYNDAAEASFNLPEGLVATEGEWVDAGQTFAEFCSENFAEDLTGKNATAKKKFVFDQATIEFGSKFVVTFTFKNGETATASNLARVKANGETYSLDGWDLKYAFSPAEYGGVEFDLYAAASTTATNFAWINNYGPAHYAAYLNDTYGEEAADILAILEAFYNYGVSVETYVATLG